MRTVLNPLPDKHEYIKYSVANRVDQDHQTAARRFLISVCAIRATENGV